MKKNLLPAIFLASLLVSLFNSGCVPSKPTEEVEILPAERLINRLEVNRRRIRNFEGNGTFIVKSNLFNNSASFRIVLEKPDSIYFTIMGPFGIELAQSLLTKNNFLFYDVIHNTVYEGKVDDQILTQIFKINLSFDELMDAFIGAVNLTDRLYKSPDKYSVDYDEYVLTYIDSLTDRTTQYRVDIKQLGITDYKILNKQKDAILEGRYSDFTLLENVAVPYNITITDFQNNQRITIKYKNMAANKPDINIDFKLPDDVKIVKW